MEGWIQLSRKLLDWEYFNDELMLRGWLYLLLKANSEDKEWKNGLVIKRGQYVTSLSKISKDLDISVQQARRILTNLQNTREITSKSTNKFTIITICKFDYYQASKKQRQQAKQQAKEQTNQQANQQANQQQLNNKKDINIKISTNVDTKSFVAPEFESVFATWLEYKHQRRESYKSDLSLKTCYNKLYKLADGDPQKAMAIVEQSMANNWAGLFPLKNEINGNNRTTYNEQRQAEREQLTRGVAATIARRLAEDDARAAKVRGS